MGITLVQKQSELDRVIAEYADNWSIKRMAVPMIISQGEIRIRFNLGASNILAKTLSIHFSQ